MSIITNYVPLHGGTITTPSDFVRAWAPTSASPSVVATVCGITESADEILSLTQGKFNLNNIVALSTTDYFGASGHFSTLSTIWGTLNTQVNDAFDNLLEYTNIAGEFTNVDPSKFDTIQTGITQIKNNLIAIKSSVDSLKTSITATRDGLAVNLPTTVSYTTAKSNYDLTIKSLATMSNRLQQGINNLKNDFPSFINGMKSEVNTYLDPDGVQSIPGYMTGMNARMGGLIMCDTTFYLKMYIFVNINQIL